MLPSCILNHVEVKSAILDTVAELEDFELVLGRFILLFSHFYIDVIHVLRSVLISHIIWNLSRLQMVHHGVHAWDLIKIDGSV